MQTNFTLGPVKQTNSGISGPVLTRTIVTPTDDTFLTKVTFEIDYVPGYIDAWLNGARCYTFEASDGQTVTFSTPPFAGDFSGGISNPDVAEPFHEAIVVGNIINSVRVANYLEYDFHDPGGNAPWDRVGPLAFDINAPQIDRPFVQDVTPYGVAIDTGAYRDYGSYSWDSENQMVIFDPPIPHSSDRHCFVNGYSVPVTLDPSRYTTVDRGDGYTSIIFNPALANTDMIYTSVYLGTLEFDVWNPDFVSLIRR